MTTFRLTVTSNKRCGCPIDQIMMDNFKWVCDLLEYEAGSELYTLSEERNLLQNGRFN